LSETLGRRCTRVLYDQKSLPLAARLRLRSVAHRAPVNLEVDRLLLKLLVRDPAAGLFTRPYLTVAVDRQTRAVVAYLVEFTPVGWTELLARIKGMAAP